MKLSIKKLNINYENLIYCQLFALFSICVESSLFLNSDIREILRCKIAKLEGHNLKAEKI